MKRNLTAVALATALAATLGSSAPAATISLTADADTYTRDGRNAGSATDLDVRGFGGADFIAYVRFDLSNLVGTITDATLKLHETAGSRNDGITNGRHQLYGLTNAAGNTPQDWDESIDLDAGAEYDNTGGAGIDLAQVFNLDADQGANVLETVPGSEGVDVTTSGADLVTFLDQRRADNGLTTFIVSINATNRGYGFASRENADSNLVPVLTLEGDLVNVPEPSALGLACLLAGLAATKRRRG